MRESAIQNSPLPASVEKAYHQKCVDLKRRLKEIEEANDAARLRKSRIERSIAKMRIERAFLLDHLAKSQQSTVDDSDKSTTPPPTPRDRPPRIKRTYQRRTSPTNDQTNSFQSPPHTAQKQNHHGFADQLDPGTNLPLIHDLPSGTSVVIVQGQPKLPPWTIHDLDPRHRVSTHFDDLPLAEQEKSMFLQDYLPYDMYGNAVAINFDARIGKYRHIFPSDADYVNPVENGERKDAEYNRRRGEEIRRGQMTDNDHRAKLLTRRNSSPSLSSQSPGGQEEFAATTSSNH